MSEAVLVTGVAGFIGFHVAQRLLQQGRQVIGLDNLNDYYDPALKHARLHEIGSGSAFSFHQLDLADRSGMEELFRRQRPSSVIHLAAQAGVRYSLSAPFAYADANLTGFLTVLEGCRHSEVKHLVYASSSSVYGANTKMPFSVEDGADHPLSLYGATKKANELMAHAYAHLFRIPMTGLRFFTVYGPWGRPDMAMWLFTDAILAGKPIKIFNHGKMQRDFTYIDDITEAIVRLVDHVPVADPQWQGNTPSPASSTAPWRVYNIGNHSPVELMHVVEVLEKAIGKAAIKEFLPMQPGDVPATFADVEALTQAVDFHPSTPIETGAERFVAWYRAYKGL